MSIGPTSSKRALISVSDKTGVVELGKGLVELGYELYSTGGTRRYLCEAGLGVVEVAQYTGFPEMMQGRVKTLHPKIFGGILCRRNEKGDVRSANEHGIALFDIVAVNLYPFRETVSNPNVELHDAVENIDIGGPSLIRAAAKNFEFVSVLTNPAHYDRLLAELRADGKPSLTLRRELMAAAFAHTAEYDRLIADFFGKRFSQTPDAEQDFPEGFHLHLRQVQSLRYGENSHQRAALYSIPGATGPTLVTARQLHGKQLSYNNILDLDAALTFVRSQQSPACCVIKHNNPCGAAISDQLAIACERAFAGDPVSAYGGVVGVNRIVDDESATFFCEHRDLFVEAIVAPDFSKAAENLLVTRPKWKANVRLIATGPFTSIGPAIELRSIAGGVLVQTADNLPDDPRIWKLVAGAAPDESLLRELAFAWSVVRVVKSNAIALTAGGMLVGIGAGQTSRIDSVRIAIDKAGSRAMGAVLASDAFFPFADSIDLAAAAGIKAVIHPGGSIRDEDVIAAAAKNNLTMMVTGKRHFRH